ncbi:hypothetical protein LCGC14_0266860 [marine sediment metagenome]|uniref:Uncharacterized protein n=1 Tax=marine sediment metagenome TaxID=412755 RepID=A0A0F9TZS4_9ZZZZ
MVLNEVYCMECEKYFRFQISEEESGDLDIPCKECGHMHFRVVEKGRITEDRWAFDLGDGKPVTREEYIRRMADAPTTVSFVYTTGTYTVSMYASSTSSSTYLTDSWAYITGTGDSANDATDAGYYHPGAP